MTDDVVRKSVQLHGLEAWFRSPGGPPPRWKMAAVTLLGVYPVSLLIGYALSPQLRKLPLGLNSFIVSVLIVSCLTWLVMPRLTRWFKPWLLINPQPGTKNRFLTTLYLHNDLPLGPPCLQISKRLLRLLEGGLIAHRPMSTPGSRLSNW